MCTRRSNSRRNQGELAHLQDQFQGGGRGEPGRSGVSCWHLWVAYKHREVKNMTQVTFSKTTWHIKISGHMDEQCGCFFKIYLFLTFES